MTARPSPASATPVQRGDLKRRFFIAVMPPPAITGPIAGLQHKGPADWDWKLHGDYHISLALPGMLTDRQLTRMIAALQTVRHDPFEAHFSGLAYFLKDPHARSRAAQNVLWARPDHATDRHMRSLHHKIARALANDNFSYGINDITPHLTVAKVPANDNSLIEAFAAAHDAQGVTARWTCDRFGLYETLDKSDPDHPAQNGGRGSRYRHVADFILRP